MREGLSGRKKIKSGVTVTASEECYGAWGKADGRVADLSRERVKLRYYTAPYTA